MDGEQARDAAQYSWIIVDNRNLGAAARERRTFRGAALQPRHILRREAAGWRLAKSCYRKLRLSPDWVASELAAAGFGHVDVDVTQGLVTIEAAKRAKTG